MHYIRRLKKKFILKIISYKLQIENNNDINEEAK